MATKLCECGCGQNTTIATATQPRFGHVKGQPHRFICGHSQRTRKRAPSINRHGYVMVRAPEHPRSKGGKGRVFEHILVAEKALGRYLPEGAVVHHVNGDPADNRPENLVVCPSQEYHMLLHQRLRALRECGHADWRKCTVCKEYDDPTRMRAYGPDFVPHHADCWNQRRRNFRRDN